MIETTVEDIVMRVESEDANPKVLASGDRPRIVVLRENQGDRILPIWAGFPEADGLALQLAGRTTPRPLTHEFMARLLEAAGARVDRVVIESFHEHTYFATVTVTASGESRDVDARPSDALNLAARVGASVFVDSKVMDDHGVASLHDMETRIMAKAVAELREAKAATGEERPVPPAEQLGGPGVVEVPA